MLATPEDNHWLNDQIKDNVVFYGNYDLGHQSFLIAKDMSYFDDVIKVIKEQLNL
jgi:FKBP-type peptidyl-prolyl cis-trans isomerase